MKDKVQIEVYKLNNASSFFDDDALMLEGDDLEESKLQNANQQKWLGSSNPGLQRNDLVRVREYGNISVPSRIRVINNNTYDILLENGEEKNGVRREEIWLNQS